MKKIKKYISKFMECVIFLVILCMLIQRVSLVVQVYGTEETEVDRRAGLFFTLPKKTVDCIFIGTSHVYCSFIPQRIYDESGITSASLATSSQSYQNTYWLLKEALRYQEPEVVVMDIHSVTSAVDEQVQKFRLHYTSGISVMPDISLNKIRAYWNIEKQASANLDKFTKYDAFGLLEYKSEYQKKDLGVKKIAKMLFCPQYEYKTFGFYPAVDVYPMENLVPNIETENYLDFYETVEYEYLNKIYQMLEKKGIQLLLTRAPYTMPEFDDYQLNRQALEWAEENNIPVIDYFKLIENNELAIDLQTDFRDADHLNYLGAKKATDYITAYLKEHYSFEDHRGDSRYRLWEEMEYDYEKVETQVKTNAGINEKAE